MRISTRTAFSVVLVGRALTALITICLCSCPAGSSVRSGGTPLWTSLPCHFLKARPSVCSCSPVLPGFYFHTSLKLVWPGASLVCGPIVLGPLLSSDQVKLSSCKTWVPTWHTQAQYLVQSLAQAWDELCLEGREEQSLLAAFLRDGWLGGLSCNGGSWHHVGSLQEMPLWSPWLYAPREPQTCACSIQLSFGYLFPQ